ncbi:MAG: peptidoglycan-associated lipoprotein Pal [Alphaproteobacteria bacterium]|jgi:peptidoglycan-associated lipoprotein|nr:peptidoglycan-associated lipoprotein Pal [Candidatus Fonsibacter sp. PEL55]
MLLNKLNKIILALTVTLFLGACATQQKATTPTPTDDAYTGTETVKYLADGVPDRVFFATNKSDLTSAASATLAKQAAYLKANPNLNVVLEGHADERGTREYNLALGERRATAAKNYLISNGIAANRIKVISYGKEKPANPASNALAWSQNRRAVTVKTN